MKKILSFTAAIFCIVFLSFVAEGKDNSYSFNKTENFISEEIGTYAFYQKDTVTWISYKYGGKNLLLGFETEGDNVDENCKIACNVIDKKSNEEKFDTYLSELPEQNRKSVSDKDVFITFSIFNKEDNEYRLLEEGSSFYILADEKDKDEIIKKLDEIYSDDHSFEYSYIKLDKEKSGLNKEIGVMKFDVIYLPFAACMPKSLLSYYGGISPVVIVIVVLAAALAGVGVFFIFRGKKIKKGKQK